MTRWRFGELGAPGPPMDGLRNRLDQRRQRRVRRRWFLRWQRKRLLLGIVALERDLVEETSRIHLEELEARHARTADRLEGNARRLFR